MSSQIVYITGGSSGIGEALAVEMAKRGYAIALGARRQEELERVVDRIRAGGGSALAIPVDVANAGEAIAAVGTAAGWQGRLDVVVANAGIGVVPGQLQDWPSTERMLAVNISGAFATLIGALPFMREQGSGHLVGVGSLAGHRGLPGFAAYSATKAALATFLEGIRVELRPSGIAVSTVYPGFVRTPLTAKNRFKMPFLVEVEDAARIVADGIMNRAAEIAFPLPLAVAAGASRFLPASLYDRLVRGVVP